MPTWYFVAAVVAVIFIALITGGMAQSKGRDGAVWFIIALLTGPLAFVAVAIFDRPDQG